MAFRKRRFSAEQYKESLIGARTQSLFLQGKHPEKMTIDELKDLPTNQELKREAALQQKIMRDPDFLEKRDRKKREIERLVIGNIQSQLRRVEELYGLPKGQLSGKATYPEGRAGSHYLYFEKNGEILYVRIGNHEPSPWRSGTGRCVADIRI